ncbi:ran-binding protein 1 homolog a-like isoform X1 [Asparagus officinalis]|uniref:ran-binding protein 1 homolog a-like isoform X1 n=1 Tax=Asparagus officinalis TaxID=4686 RepID=UPI00098DEC2E|nr:ran-binding protein 1 homolog a-like isoform X1 [Asparagus officinalis]
MASSSDVKLNEVDFTGDEEEEEAIFHMKAKLSRFDEWVNGLFDEGRGLYGRGNGIVKLLKHRGTGKVRLVFMNASTLKIRLNFDVVSPINLQEKCGDNASCIWYVRELKEEKLCIRFRSVEDNKEFMETVERINESLRRDE